VTLSLNLRVFKISPALNTWNIQCPVKMTKESKLIRLFLAEIKPLMPLFKEHLFISPYALTVFSKDILCIESLSYFFF
jgi:hypothetical protein